jgi:hypothetical protein
MEIVEIGVRLLENGDWGDWGQIPWEIGVRFLEIRYDRQPIVKESAPSPSPHQKDAASMLPKPPDEPVQAR